MRLQELPSHKNPLTELRRASSVVPWIALLGRKVLAVPATSGVPERMFSSPGSIMTKKRARVSCDHLEELMYLHEVWSSEGVDDHEEDFLGVVSTDRPHAYTHKHTHAYTKNPLGRMPCFFVETNNKYQKRNRFHFRDSLFFFYKYRSTS